MFFFPSFAENKYNYATQELAKFSHQQKEEPQMWLEDFPPFLLTTPY